ncbi:MAG: hypothetical protein FWD52_07770 [Candidatus Bathyarchaeota archaeon]|nr:hypothetical protein [Candidatus Termiticorpusculum sp.]
MKISKSVMCVVMSVLFVVSLLSVVPVQALTPLIKEGELYVYGSSTVYPISAQAVVPFQEYVSTLPSPFSSVKVFLNEEGSGAGFNALRASSPTTDIAASSRSGGSTAGFYGESYPVSGSAIVNPQEFLIGYDSVAIIVPVSNTWLSQASASEVADLFRSTGNGNGVAFYRTWGDWANANGITLPPTVAAQEIGRIGREVSSGTFDGFNTFFLSPFGYPMAYSASTGTTGQNWLPNNYVALTSNQEVMTQMNQPANAFSIGFIGLGFVQGNPVGIKALNLYNPTTGAYIAPTVANVKNSVYVNNPPTGNPAVIIRPLYYFMDGIPAANSPEAVKSLWISFIKAHDEYLTKEGFITMNRVDFAGPRTGAGNSHSGNPNSSVGTQTVPDGVVDIFDLVYFTNAWIAYNSNAKQLNPYVDISGSAGLPDGKIDFYDLVAFTNGWIAYYRNI